MKFESERFGVVRIWFESFISEEEDDRIEVANFFRARKAKKQKAEFIPLKPMPDEVTCTIEIGGTVHKGTGLRNPIDHHWKMAARAAALTVATEDFDREQSAEIWRLWLNRPGKHNQPVLHP